MDKTISFERCVEIINEEIYTEVQLTVDDYRTSARRPIALRNSDITFESYLKSFETDEKQKTQRQYILCPTGQVATKAAQTLQEE